MAEYKIVVEQKIVNDTTYVKKFIWTIVDEENKVYQKGEEDTRILALEAGRKKYRKYKSE